LIDYKSIFTKIQVMRNSEKIIVVTAAATLIGVALIAIDKIRIRMFLNNIADEGYETAHDILYPKKSKGEKRLRFGPVLPGE
jgi:hypothetical protein